MISKAYFSANSRWPSRTLFKTEDKRVAQQCQMNHNVLKSLLVVVKSMRQEEELLKSNSNLNATVKLLRDEIASLKDVPRSASGHVSFADEIPMFHNQNHRTELNYYQN